MNNFIITGMPRSGTKFLAHAMDRSKNFNVVHDHEQMKMNKLRKSDINKYISFVNNRLNKENYGEISGLYRIDRDSKTSFDKFEANKKGIILRNPIKNIISLYNMAGMVNGENYVTNLPTQLKILDQIANMEDVKVIFFDQMTKDKDYLQSVIEYFGIEDVQITDDIVRKKVNERTNYISLETIGNKKVNQLREKTDWFTEKYDLERI
jgi:hypothetical protein